MINNRNTLDTQKNLKNVKKTLLYEANEDGGTYSHHASLAYFKGKFYAVWSNGQINEDDIGQRVMIASSCDGEHFSAPKPLFDKEEGNAVLTAAGLYVRDDGKICAYAGLYYYPDSKRPKGDMHHLNTTLLVKESEDGETWTDSVDLHVPIVPNQGPQRLASGRVIIVGNITFPYTDSEDGISGWVITGVPPAPIEGFQDDSEGFHVHAELREDKLHLCEGSYFEMPDGEIRMLLRDAGKKENINERYLALSRSFDGGRTYSLPEETEFTDNNSKFYCMRLSNCKYAIISNPDVRGSRCPLSISISDDGENFTRRYNIATEKLSQRFEGMYKGGVYGYPHAMEIDGRMYVICSINKEDIAIFSFDISELD